MSTNYYVLLFIIIFFYGCNQKNNNLTSVYSYKIEAENESEFDLEKIASYAGMIPLETTDECLIGKIQNVFLTDSAIIIFDSQQKKILLFDRYGNYKYQIGSRGPGPAEYRGIECVYFDEIGNRIFISDPIQKKIIQYDINGYFISSWQSEYFIYAFYPTVYGYWVVNAGQNDKYYYIILYILIKKIIK